MIAPAFLVSCRDINRAQRGMHARRNTLRMAPSGGQRDGIIRNMLPLKGEA